MKVVMVMRSGGDYTAAHVETLARQVAEHLPGFEIACLSDCDVPVPRIALRGDWPGWWSKMELFAPWIRGDLLYFDLDTVLCGDMGDIAGHRRLTLLRDFYRKDGLGSGMMFLPEEARADIWRQWIANPDRWMAECGTLGDQNFLERFWLQEADRWQDVVPGQVVSYKVHVRKAQSKREKGSGKVPVGASVICFHGDPRPWKVRLKY